MKNVCSFIFCFLPILMLAQHSQTPTTGARGAAMGGVGVTFSDINSVFGNQAGLAHLESAAAVVFAERRFIESPINSLSAAFAYPVGFGTFGLSVNTFGVKNYQEQKIGLAYARRLFNNLSIGAQFDYLNTNIPLYGTRGAISLEVGLQAQILKDLQFGFHLYNPLEIEIAEDSFLPTIYRAGLLYTPSEFVLLTAEVEKDIDYVARFRAGIEYRFSDLFFMRTGFATAPTLVSLGLGLSLQGGLAVDVAASYHQVLGISPSVGVTYDFSK